MKISHTIPYQREKHSLLNLFARIAVAKRYIMFKDAFLEMTIYQDEVDALVKFSNNCVSWIDGELLDRMKIQ